MSAGDTSKTNNWAYFGKSKLMTLKHEWSAQFLWFTEKHLTLTHSQMEYRYLLLTSQSTQGYGKRCRQSRQQQQQQRTDQP